MIWLLGWQGQAATLGQHCQWLTRKPGSWELTVRVWPFQDGRISAPNPARRGLRMHSFLPQKRSAPSQFSIRPIRYKTWLLYGYYRLRVIQNCKVCKHVCRPFANDSPIHSLPCVYFNCFHIHLIKYAETFLWGRNRPDYQFWKKTTEYVVHYLFICINSCLKNVMKLYSFLTTYIVTIKKSWYNCTSWVKIRYKNWKK